MQVEQICAYIKRIVCSSKNTQLVRWYLKYNISDKQRFCSAFPTLVVLFAVLRVGRNKTAIFCERKQKKAHFQINCNNNRQLYLNAECAISSESSN